MNRHMLVAAMLLYRAGQSMAVIREKQKKIGLKRKYECESLKKKEPEAYEPWNINIHTYTYIYLYAT